MQFSTIVPLCFCDARILRRRNSHRELVGACFITLRPISERRLEPTLQGDAVVGPVI